MVRAYLLIEADPGSGSDLLPRLRGLSLGNCLLLAEQMMPGEIVAHLHCNDLPDVTQALAGDIAPLAGVKRATVLALINRE